MNCCIAPSFIGKYRKTFTLVHAAELCRFDEVKLCCLSRGSRDGGRGGGDGPGADLLSCEQVVQLHRSQVLDNSTPDGARAQLVAVSSLFGSDTEVAPPGSRVARTRRRTRGRAPRQPPRWITDGTGRRDAPIPSGIGSPRPPCRARRRRRRETGETEHPEPRTIARRARRSSY